MADTPSWDVPTAPVPSWELEARKPSWETEVKKPEVGVAEDMAKSAVSGTGTGLLAIPGMGGDLQQLAQAGANKVNETTGVGDYLGDKISKGLGSFDKFMAAHTYYDPEKTKRMEKSGLVQGARGDIPGSYELPSTKDLQGQVEKVTGKFYEPKTWEGRITHGATSALPAAATGGEGALISALRAGGAGVGGEVGNQVASVAPEAAQPWIRAAGNALGFMGGPRALTWNPMTAEQLAATSTLSPEMKAASTAGQWTDSPFWRGMETYSTKGANAPARQAEVFTQDALRRADHQGPLRDIGDTLDRQSAERENIRRSNEINPTELLNLQAKNAMRVRPLQNTAANAADIQPYTELERDMYFGPRRGQTPQPPPPTTIPGERYQNLKDSVNAQVDANRGGSALGHAFQGMRNDLDTAWENSIGPTVAQEYNNLGRQQRAGMTVREAIPNKPNTDTINPNDLYKAATGRHDRPMADYAENSARVMTGMPNRAERAPAWFNLLNTLGAAGLGAGTGHAAGGLAGAVGGGLLGAGAVERGVLGHLMADALWRGGAGAIGKVAASSPVQAMAKNQLGRPPDVNVVDPRVLATVNALRLAAPKTQE